MVQAIRVWRFEDAPINYKTLSEHGGDEDWLAHVPKGVEDEIWWAQEGSSFGCHSVTRHDLEDGSYVLIGAHS